MTAPSSEYALARTLRANAYLSLRRVALVSAVLAVLAVLLSGGLGAGLYVCSTSSRVVPYIVRVDGDGRTVGIGQATAAADPDRAMIEHSIRLWVINSRSVTSDGAAQSRLIREAYAYSGGRAVGLLNEWYREHPPYGAGRTITPTITSYLQIDETTYQVEWVEVRRAVSGVAVRRETWRALVTIRVEPPGEDLERRIINPLGIRVVDFDWTRILDSKTSTSEEGVEP